jgi:hypothetical protein
MSALTAFEVQSLQNGSWKIEAITDSKDFAVHTAEQVMRSRTVTKVRVVQETVDPDSSHAKTRIVFFRDKYAAKPATTPADERDKLPSAAPAPAPPSVTAKSRKSWGTTAIGLAINFGAIVIVGIGLILALRYLAAP